jgi:hypothetical protein
MLLPVPLALAMPQTVAANPAASQPVSQADAAVSVASLPVPQTAPWLVPVPLPLAGGACAWQVPVAGAALEHH